MKFFLFQLPVRLARHAVHAGLMCAALWIAAADTARAEQWMQPTPEELHMTAQPQVPGAPAVYLFREETTEDQLHMYSVYVRLKVLNEAGKDRANVELRYLAGTGQRLNYTDVAGRTIHPDGTVIPFTGKPYSKLIVREGGQRYMAKVFTLPDVEVGSILEYRYKLRWEDYFLNPPQWVVQSDLYTRKAHFQWRPTNQNLIITDERGRIASTIAWAPILPPGVSVKQTQLPAIGGHDGQLLLDLDVGDIAPQPREEAMPPIASLSYRVMFYYTPFASANEFWRKEGAYWARQQDRFIGPGAGVKAAAAELVSPGDTPDAKLRKLYAAVQRLENTDFTRDHSASEDRAEGERKLESTDDVLARKRGSSNQLAELFLAMARAEGFKAYAMAVTDRDQHLFFPGYLSFAQFDDILAIVNVDGKEVFFDPGSRFCPYGQLAWKHTLANGVRETEAGVVLAGAPAESYRASSTERTANLTMDEHGAVHGTVSMRYTGAPALMWRQASLEGDDESFKRQMRESVEALLPRTLEVKLVATANLENYEQPLIATFEVKGLPGTSTGRRLLLPVDLFLANNQAHFTRSRREVAVDLEYPRMVRDALRINFPPGFAVESLPAVGRYELGHQAAYGLTTEQSPTSFTVRRDFVLGEIIFPPAQYPALREFYSKVDQKDSDSVVLKLADTAPAQAQPGAN